MTLRWTAWGPAAIWAGVLFFLSAQPGKGGSPVFFAGEDKVAHLVLYAIFGITLAMGARRRLGTRGAWAALLLGFLFGVSDEWHQSFVPLRDPSVGDLAADTVGLFLGYWLFSLYLTGRTVTGAAPSHRTDPGPQPE